MISRGRRNNAREERHNVAIVLAAGKGSRMHSDIPKQYLKIGKHPVLYYTLRSFERCPEVFRVILVTGEGEEDYCKEQIVSAAGFEKVCAVISGGKERYDSVFCGLRQIRRMIGEGSLPGCDYVLVHDGARPMVDEALLRRNLETAYQKGTAVTGVPVKDTIKICRAGEVAQTPDRRALWQVQTPQTFPYEALFAAYEQAISEGAQGITDDAMVMERWSGLPVCMSLGDYRNIKITTPEDLQIAGLYL